MPEPEITDDQIRIELKRMLAAEKGRILAQFDEHVREVETDPAMPPDERIELAQKLTKCFDQARSQVDRTIAAFSDFIDRREASA